MVLIIFERKERFCGGSHRHEYASRGDNLNKMPVAFSTFLKIFQVCLLCPSRFLEFLQTSIYHTAFAAGLSTQGSLHPYAKSKQELTNHICLCFQRSMLKRTGLVNSGGKRSLQGSRSDRIQYAFKFDRPAVPAYIPVVEQQRYAGSTTPWFQVQKPLDLCLDARMMPHLVSLDRWNVVCNKPNSWSTEPGMQRNFGKTMQRLVHSSMKLKQS